MKNILIIVDMQNDFVDGALGTKEAVSIIDNAVKKIKSFDGDIIVTLDTHYDNYSQTQEGKKLPVPHCIKNTDGWHLNSKIQNALNTKSFTVIEKTTFGSKHLPEYIGEKYSSEKFRFELIGLCTDICVVSNALILKSAFPEAEISVDASCCAGVTVESHNAALLTMKMCQINITNGGELNV